MLDSIEMFILGGLQTIYDQFGWGGVIAVMVFENATGLTPSEIVLAFAGWFLISAQDLPLSFIWLGGLYASIGSTFGASLTYWATRIGGRPLVERMARWIRLDPALIEKSEKQFNQWGSGLVFAGRMVPGIRTLINFPAGLARMPFYSFLIATFIGTYLWCTFLLGAGYVLGHEWNLISQFIKDHLLLFFAAGTVLLVAAVYLRGRMKKKFLTEE